MTVRSEKDGPITKVILDRKERRNAVDRGTAQALASAFKEFDADADASVAVLFGDHGTFCAGADLRALGGADQNRIEDEGDGPMGPSRMILEKPVIAAIAGHAVAGGLELALWCDLRVMEEDAILGIFCRRWGVPLIDGGTVRLPHIVGLGRALDLILTGRAVDAREALAMGLVDRVVPKGQALSAAASLARDIARFPQTCVRTDRRATYEALGLPLEEALRVEFTHGKRALAAPELGASVGRFVSGQGRGGRVE